MLYTRLQPGTGREPKGIAQDVLSRAFGHALARATGIEGES